MSAFLTLVLTERRALMELDDTRACVRTTSLVTIVQVGCNYLTRADCFQPEVRSCEGGPGVWGVLCVV